MLPCGSLGLFICTHAMSQDCHMAALIHIFLCGVSQHCFWRHGLAWSLASDVPAQTCDGRGSSPHMSAIFLQCHMGLWACLFEAVLSNCLQECYVPLPQCGAAGTMLLCPYPCFFAHLPGLIVAIRQPGQACLHACCILEPEHGVWACLLECPSTITWQPGNACLPTYCVPVSPHDSTGYLLVFELCPTSAVRQCG